MTTVFVPRLFAVHLASKNFIAQGLNGLVDKRAFLFVSDDTVCKTLGDNELFTGSFFCNNSQMLFKRSLHLQTVITTAPWLNIRHPPFPFKLVFNINSVESIPPSKPNNWTDDEFQRLNRDQTNKLIKFCHTLTNQTSFTHYIPFTGIHNAYLLGKLKTI